MSQAVVTGVSLLSAAGGSADQAFRAALDGRCAGEPGGFDPPMDRIPLAAAPAIEGLAETQARWPERSAAMAVLAATAALADAGLAVDHMRRENSALVVGASKAGVLTILEAAQAALARGGEIDPAGAQAALAHRAEIDADLAGRLWRWGTPACAAGALCEALHPAGPVVSIAAACATGLTALATGAALIAEGRADTVLVAATDATIHPLFVGSFYRMGVLAPWRTHPTDACRPFAADRAGFVLGEGAGAIVLQAPRRGRNSAVAVVGAAAGSQATDLVRPADSSDVLAATFARARVRAGWRDRRVDLVHAHGTGTPAGDLAETVAIRKVMAADADRTVCVSTKPITGHMLGAAGIAQAVLTVKAMQAGQAPPTANSRLADPACDLDYNREGVRELDIQRAVCMASGFGGACAAVAFERTD